MKVVLTVSALLLLASCGNDAPQTKEEYIENFTQYEDSIKKKGNDKLNFSNQKDALAYAERCLEIAHRFPKEAEAPEYMDKAHMILAGAGMHSRSAMLADTIITMYPQYKNRAMVLESAAVTYDMFILPRRKDKVKKYYELLLKDYPNLPKEQKENIKFRLENIDLSFDELIEKQQTASSN